MGGGSWKLETGLNRYLWRNDITHQGALAFCHHRSDDTGFCCSYEP